MLSYNIKKIISKKTKLGLLFPHFDIAPLYPLFILVNITLKCNKKCSWCYEHHDRFYESFTEHMPINMFQKILRSFRYFKPHLHIFGGEPLFHPEFPLFLEYCKGNGYRPSLTTNGDYLDKYSESIISSSLSQINISLNAIIDGKGNFNIIFQKKIKDFVKLNEGRKIINFNYVIEPETYAYLEKVASFLSNDLQEKEFSLFVLQHFNLQLKTDMLNSGFDIDKLIDVLSRVKRTKIRSKMLFLPDIKIADLGTYYRTRFAFKNKCYTPWLGLSIYPDLTVTPGGGIFACNCILGNLNQMAIMDIWRGVKLKDFRLRLIRQVLPEECNRCCHKFYY